ncbi:MAG: hypothetical protein ABR915_23460 [Thermoguttaceae bacterium]|jgi:hypothetical protein
MTKRITFLCVVWVASLAFGEDSPPKAVAPKPPEAGVTSMAGVAHADLAPKPDEPMPQVPLFTDASGAEKSSPFSQFPPGFSMEFNLSGSFDLSFDMKVDKEKAKHKTHDKAKTKKKATKKAKSKPKTEKTE